MTREPILAYVITSELDTDLVQDFLHKKNYCGFVGVIVLINVGSE